MPLKKKTPNFGLDKEGDSIVIKVMCFGGQAYLDSSPSCINSSIWGTFE